MFRKMACFPQVCYSIYSWSTTAGTNASSDAAINWAEGQLPSTVNDSARAMMAALAAWVKDSGGGNTTGGTTTAYTLSSSQAMLSKTAALIAFKAHATNTGACTLNVDSLGASALRSSTGAALVAGDIAIGNIYLATWVSGSSEWLLVNNPAGNVKLSGGTMTGLLILSADPSNVLGAATKQYADAVGTTAQAKTISAGTGLSGGGALSTNPTLSIANSGVTATQLASDAVVTAKILDANVTPAKLSQPFTAMTATTASGTGVNFGSIPSWVKRITVLCRAVAFSGADVLRLQIGPSGGVETSGYAGITGTCTGGTMTSLGSGFDVAFGASTSPVYGRFVIDYIGSNIWVCTGQISIVTGSNVSVISGTKTLAGTLTQLTVKGVSGQSFSGGTIQVNYE
jgi:hypothetical protein